MKNTTETSFWGRAKFGGSPATLIALSLTAGALTALALSWTIAIGVDQEQPWWLIALTALPFLPVTVAGTWALCVDRSAISHAPKNPEHSIEKIWYSQAAETTFHIMLFSLGLATALFTIFGWSAPAGTLLAVATGFCMVCFIASYQFHKRKAA